MLARVFNTPSMLVKERHAKNVYAALAKNRSIILGSVDLHGQLEGVRIELGMAGLRLYQADINV